MDVFIEKIVTKKKNAKDSAITLAIIVVGLILSMIIFSFKVTSSFAPFIIVGLIYGAYRLITTRNIEFEYAVTNGDLDIDKIISQRKRKRIFSASCKDFEIVAKPASVYFTQDMKNINKQIHAVSSIDSPDVYFVSLNYKGEKTVVYFEPDKRMLDAFKTYIPRKVFE